MLEFHGSFTYHGGETLRLSSDDDSWVFIDNQLIEKLDLGGLHSSGVGSAAIDLDVLNRPDYYGNPRVLNLVVGQTYPIDIFYAERQTPSAVITLQTDLQIVAPEVPYSYQVRAVDSDGGAITYALLKGPEGMTINPDTGLVSWPPDRIRVGTYEVVVEALDETGPTDTQTYTLTVSGSSYDGQLAFTSTPPESVEPGETYTYTPTVNAPAGDKLTYSLISRPYISDTDRMTIDPATGTVTWAPQPGDFGQQYTVSIQVTDDRGAPLGRAVQSFTLHAANAPNNPPRFKTTPPPVVTATAGQLYTDLAEATDVDNDRLTYDLPVCPDGMLIDPSTGQIYWVPTSGQGGPQDVLVRVQDGRGGVDLLPFTIAVAKPNRPPQITSLPPQLAQSGLAYQYQVSATDPDGDTPQYSIGAAGQALGMSIGTQSGLLTWPASLVVPGTYPVTVIVTDGRGGQTSQSYGLEVTDTAYRPQIVPDHRQTVQPGRTYLYQVLVAARNDSDPNDPVNGRPYPRPLKYDLDTASHALGFTIDPTAGLVRWTPVPAQFRTNAFTVTVTDLLTGGTDSHAFTVQVVSQGANHDPVITSHPKPGAVVGNTYLYGLTGTDPDGDPLSWSPVTVPDGLVVDAVTGRVAWTPTDDQVGPQQVTVRADDGQGGWAEQTFTVTVRGVDVPPRITSIPVTQATAGRAYDYQVTATDAESDPLTYSIDAVSIARGITIDPVSGLVHWANPTPVGGQYPVTIQVADGLGGFGYQNYTLVVVSATPNEPPVFHATPRTTAGVGLTYSYTPNDPAVTDPDQDGPFTFSLRVTLGQQTLSVPLPHMTFNQATGALTWTPTADQVGRYTVTVTATDAGNPAASAAQTFPLEVVNDTGQVTVDPIPDETVARGAAFRYDVRASDSDGDRLTYTLDPNSPGWLSVDANGRITGTPPADAPASNTVTVTATDPYGKSASATFHLAVGSDTTYPTVQVFEDANPADKGAVVTFLVVAEDNVGIASVTLRVGTTDVAVDDHGVARYQVPSTGTFPLTLQVVATATDVSGLTSTANAALSVIDPTDTSAPIATLQSLLDPRKQGADPVPFAGPNGPPTITAPMDVYGTADTSPAGSATYTLQVAPVGSNAFTTIKPSTSGLTGVLGRFDPTMLADGSYVLRLTVTGANGHTATDERVVNVAGRLKLGNLHLSSTDLTIPLAGIPITITRTYDTLNANRQGDFGYGWTLTEDDFQLQVSQPDGTVLALGEHAPFRRGTRVTLTGPDGNPEGFTFWPRVILSSVYTGSQFYEPAFIADAGVTDTLTVPYAELYDNGDGTFSSAGDMMAAYDPADCGNAYTLTTRAGTAYALDASTGLLSNVADRHGNTLNFEGSGIYSSTGVAITFQRDPVTHDITSITDPRGNSITYHYDAAGNLDWVIDRAGQKTTFAYAGPPHYIDHVLDADNRVVARIAYTDGRVTGLTDAAGNTTALQPDPVSLTMTVTPPSLGGGTNPSATLHYDDQGNVTSATDALGNTATATYTGAGKDLLGSQSQTVDGKTLTTGYGYDANGQVTATTDPLGETTRITYGPFGLPETVTDAAGNTTRFHYDATTGDLLSTSSPTGVSTSSAYYSDGQVKTSTSASGTTSYSYYAPGEAGGMAGRVKTVTDARGVMTAYAYDANGNQTRAVTVAVDPDANPGHPEALPANIFAPGDRLVQTTSNGLVTETVTDPQNRVVWAGVAHVPGLPTSGTRTTYNADGSIASTATYAGVTITVTSNVYDANDRLIQTTSPTGTVTDTYYDENGRVSWTDDAHLPGAAHVDGTHTVYDAAGRAVRTEQYHDVVISVDTTTNPAAPRSTYGTSGARFSVSSTVYDARGQAVWTDDAHDPSQPADGTHTVYDADGRVIATLRYSNVQIDLVTDTDGSYSTALNLGTLGAELSTTETLYDAAGRAVWTDDPHQPGSPPVGGTHTVYDDAGRVQSTERHTGVVLNLLDADTNNPSVALGSQGVLYSATGSTYDAAGRLKTSTDALGRTAVYDYDGDGRLTKTTYADHTTTSTTYDPATGRKLSDTDQDGHTTTYGYNDAFGDLTDVYLPAVTDPTQTGSPLVRPHYQYGYDAFGNLETQTDPYGHTTTFAYDAFGHKVCETLPTTDQGTPTETWHYDPLGRLDQATDFDAHVTTYLYDAEGRVTRKDVYVRPEALAANSPTVAVTYAYDRYDASRRYETVTTVTDTANPGAVGSTTSYYDLEGRLVEIDTVQGGATYWVRYAYDPATGQKTDVTTANTHVRYAYDQNGRLQTVKADKLDGQDLSATPLVTTYVYDAADRLVSTTLPNGTVETRTYDGVYGADLQVAAWGAGVPTSGTNLVVVGTDAGGLLHVRIFDAVGGITDASEATLPDARAQAISALKQQLSGLMPPHVLTGAEKAEVLAEVALIVGQTRGLGSLTSVVTRQVAGGPVLTSFLYTVDDAGLRTAVTEAGGRTVRYTYDDDGRLTGEDVYASPTATSPVRSFAYTYDLAGNRHTMYDGGGGSGVTSLTYTYDAEDRLRTVSGVKAGSPYSATYSYDPNGSTLSVSENGVVTWNTWDVEGRLIQDVQGGGGHTVAYTYDDAGDRTSQTVDGQTTTYLNDPNQAYDQVLEEYAPGGVLAATYVRGSDLLFQDRTAAGGGAGRWFYAKDGLGSTRALTDGGGTRTDTYTYDAFGNLNGQWHLGNPMQNEFLFAGYQTDAATGLDYLRARYLDTAVGRLTSRDYYNGSASDPITQNHYAYASENPISNVDYSGFYTNVEVSIAPTEAMTIEVNAGTLAAQGYNTAIAATRVAAFITNLRIFGAAALAAAPTVLGATALAALTFSPLNYAGMMANEMLIGKRKQLLEGIEAGTVLQGAVSTRSISRSDALSAGLIVPSDDTSGNTIPIFLEPISVLHSVAETDLRGQLKMQPMLLHHIGQLIINGRRDFANFNRRGSRDASGAIDFAQQRDPNLQAQDGESYEEYPFASSAEGGPGAHVEVVPDELQDRQGGLFRAFLRANQITQGSRRGYIVLVIP
jgi:fibro-slime domain-containing protein/RHS repeat-associated protein